MKSCYRIGIDVGGTFTDLAAFDEETGTTHILKLPSTPGNPGKGVIEAISNFLSAHPGDIELIVHASTVGTNLFLGQLGLTIPRGALVTTKGFRDVLDIGRQKRAEIYNPFFQRPTPLIEPHFRYVVDERIDFTGKVIKAPQEGEIRKLADDLQRNDVETVAVVFLHSYINPEHEKEVCRILGEELPGVPVIPSCEVDPEYREYERMSTTIVNSLMIPVISRYLNSIVKDLRGIGVNAPLYIMQSNGGLSSVENATDFPVSTIESGPATGVTASAYWSQLLGSKQVICFDMGGTTAKAGVVIGGVSQMVSECEVGGLVHSGRSIKGSGYPVRYPFVDLAEVSGGGGTIAWVDEGGALMVGPISAGADPGPACYGLGGDQPTVTDANLVLGRMNTLGLSGGAIKVYPDLAEGAIEEKVAGRLGISVVEAASGIIEIVNTHMMRAVRLVSIERGHDPRDFTMMAFGGSGPMHAAFLADGLGIDDIMIPPSSGVFSALGLMLADFRHDFSRAILRECTQVNNVFLEDVYADMEKEALETLDREGFSSDSIIMERNLSMRYMGQSHELMIPIQEMGQRIDKSFHARHREVYGYASSAESIEVVNACLVAYGLTSKPIFPKMSFANNISPDGALAERRQVHFSQTGWTETPIYSRDLLLPGNRIEGPAIIEQYDSTNIIPPEWKATVDELANLHLKRKP